MNARTLSRGRALSAGLVLLLCSACPRERGSPPSISNLRFTPTSAVLHAGNESVTVTGAIDFADPEGDVVALRLTSSAGADMRVLSLGGARSGTIEGSFIVSTQFLATYTFEVWVVDSEGSASNTLDGTFDVKIDDTGTRWTPRVSGVTRSSTP